MISDKGEKVMTEIRTTYLFTIALTLDEIQLLGKTPLNRGEKADPSDITFALHRFSKVGEIRLARCPNKRRKCR
jgi:hypothetical protein